MIVQPDFPDHWKTRLLVRLCGPDSVLCLLRFWSHCQNRRKWVFEGMTPAILASICAWTGDEKVFCDAMTQTFLDVDGDTVTAHEWEEINHKLIHNWEVGKKGGRPKTNHNAKIDPPAEAHQQRKKTQGLSQGLTQGVTDRGEGGEGLDRLDGGGNTPNFDFAGMTQEEVMTNLHHQFPKIDVWNEYRKLKQRSVDKGEGNPTWASFIGWLKKASPPANLRKSSFPKPDSRKKEDPREQPCTPEEQAELARQLSELKAQMNGTEAPSPIAESSNKKTIRPPTDEEAKEEEERRRMLDAQREQIRTRTPPRTI
jgi:hypothetical protein